MILFVQFLLTTFQIDSNQWRFLAQHILWKSNKIHRVYIDDRGVVSVELTERPEKQKLISMLVDGIVHTTDIVEVDGRYASVIKTPQLIDSWKENLFEDIVFMEQIIGNKDFSLASIITDKSSTNVVVFKGGYYLYDFCRSHFLKNDSSENRKADFPITWVICL